MKFLSWRDRLKDLIMRPAIHRFYGEIPPENTAMDDKVVRLERGKSYVRVKIIQMFLGYQQIWTSRRMPVVHAFPHFLQSSGEVELPVIIGPNKLKDVDGAHTDRVISLNQTVFGPVPYLGGSLDLLIALFAAETEDYADQFFALLGSINDVVPRAELSTAIGLLKPVNDGLKSLLDLNKLTIQVGVQDTFSNPDLGDVSNPLCSGYRALIAKDASDIKVKDLWLDKDGLHVMHNGKPGELLSGCDYLVFQIEKLDNRDWLELPSLCTSWKKVEDAVTASQGKWEIVDQAYSMFKWGLLGCGDLLMQDRIRVLNDQTNQLKTLWEAARQKPFEGFSLAAPEFEPNVEELRRNVLTEASKKSWR